MSLISITLVFENCEYVVIPKEYLTSLSISGITTSESYDVSKGTFRENLQAECIFLIIKDFSNLRTVHDTNLSDRIRSWGDITCVSLNLLGSSDEDYQVNWKGADPYNNEAQTYTIEDSFLTIKIGEK